MGDTEQILSLEAVYARYTALEQKVGSQPAVIWSIEITCLGEYKREK